MTPLSISTVLERESILSRGLHPGRCLDVDHGLVKQNITNPFLVSHRVKSWGPHLRRIYCQPTVMESAKREQHRLVEHRLVAHGHFHQSSSAEVVDLDRLEILQAQAL